MVDRYRHALGLDDADTCLSARWLDQDIILPRLLRCFVLLNRDMPASAGRFNILPLSAIRAHFITIDASVLHGILKDIGVVKCGYGAFAGVADAHWRSVMHIDRLTGKDRQFTGTVDSDGTSVCVHFTRPRVARDDAKDLSAAVGQDGNPYTRMLRQDDRVLGLDPGRKDIAHVGEVLPDGRFASYTLSRAQYYREAGICVANRQSATWNAGVRVAINALSGASPKGSCLLRFRVYVTVYLTHRTALWLEYLKDRWANQRLRLYGGKKRAFAHFYNRVADADHTKRRVVIAYGSAKFAASGRGEAAVPTTRAFKECAQRFVTAVVSEYLTTKKHYRTGQLLQLVRQKETGRQVRGLLWCGSTNSNGGKFINRDLNAALNIRLCLLSATRPEPLRYDPNRGPYRQTVGRVVRR